LRRLVEPKQYARPRERSRNCGAPVDPAGECYPRLSGHSPHSGSSSEHSWYSSFPSIPTDHSARRWLRRNPGRHDATQSPSREGLNLLLLPWPMRVETEDFQEVSTCGVRRDGKPLSFRRQEAEFIRASVSSRRSAVSTWTSSARRFCRLRARQLHAIERQPVLQALHARRRRGCLRPARGIPSRSRSPIQQALGGLMMLSVFPMPRDDSRAS
jgi:hypothetical protein